MIIHYVQLVIIRPSAHYKRRPSLGSPPAETVTTDLNDWRSVRAALPLGRYTKMQVPFPLTRAPMVHIRCRHEIDQAAHAVHGAGSPIIKRHARRLSGGAHLRLKNACSYCSALSKDVSRASYDPRLRGASGLLPVSPPLETPEKVTLRLSALSYQHRLMPSRGSFVSSCHVTFVYVPAVRGRRHLDAQSRTGTVCDGYDHATFTAVDTV